MTVAIVNRLREARLVDQQRLRLKPGQNPRDGSKSDDRRNAPTKNRTQPTNRFPLKHYHFGVDAGGSPIVNLPPSERACTVRSYIPSAYSGGTVKVPRFVGFSR